MENEKEENEKPRQKTMTTSQDDTNKEDNTTAAAIEKGVRFWTHPSLLQVSTDEKMQYLRSRGLSKDEIHRVWEKVVDDNPNEQPDVLRTSLREQQQRTSVPAPPPYNPPFYNEMPQSNYDSESPYDIPVLLTIGGALGLTAAAVFRWLNGGDFLFLPPPTRQGDTVEEATPIRESSINIETSVEEKEEIGIEEEEELLVPPTNNNKDGGLEQVIQVLETHSSQQERILQQLSNFTTKQMTDQSMNLLRNSGTSSREALTKQLTDIKEELTTIAGAGSQSGTTSGTSWETRLEESLHKLNECMALLLQQDTAGPFSSNIAAPAPTESPSAFQSLAVGTQETASSSDNKSLSLREAIQTLAEENESSQLRAGAQLLYLYVINLSSHPHVPRYRKIFTTNESFQKVEQLVGGKELLLAVGFVQQQHQHCLEWEGGESEEEMTYLKEAAAALSILKSASPSSSSEDITTNALSVLRPSTPPPLPTDPSSCIQTPYFIASPPNTKKHPLLTESGDELDISTISEHFESRLESLAHPAMDDLRMFHAPDRNGDSLDSIPRTNLTRRESSDEPEEVNDCE